MFFFLLLHIVDVSLVNASPAAYGQISQLHGNVLLRLFEVGMCSRCCSMPSTGCGSCSSTSSREQRPATANSFAVLSA